MEKPVAKLKVGDKVILRKSAREISEIIPIKGLEGLRILLRFSDGTQQTLGGWTWLTLANS